VELVTGSDPNAVWQKVWDEQQTALLAVRATAAAAKVQEEQGLQQGLQQQRQASELSVSQGATSPPLSVQQQAGSGGGGGDSEPKGVHLLHIVTMVATVWVICN
jgi:hypothetical protein